MTGYSLATPPNNLPIKADSFLGGPGGQAFDEPEYRREALRADLCELASRISFQHGPRIVDALLRKYDINRKL